MILFNLDDNLFRSLKIIRNPFIDKIAANVQMAVSIKASTQLGPEHSKIVAIEKIFVIINNLKLKKMDFDPEFL